MIAGIIRNSHLIMFNVIYKITDYQHITKHNVFCLETVNCPPNINYKTNINV